MPPEEDRPTATKDLHTKFGEDTLSGSRNILADKLTHTERHTDGLIAQLRNGLKSKTTHCHAFCSEV